MLSFIILPSLGRRFQRAPRSSLRVLIALLTVTHFLSVDSDVIAAPLVSRAPPPPIENPVVLHPLYAEDGSLSVYLTVGSDKFCIQDDCEQLPTWSPSQLSLGYAQFADDKEREGVMKKTDNVGKVKVVKKPEGANEVEGKGKEAETETEKGDGEGTMTSWEYVGRIMTTLYLGPTFQPLLEVSSVTDGEKVMDKMDRMQECVQTSIQETQETWDTCREKEEEVITYEIHLLEYHYIDRSNDKTGGVCLRIGPDADDYYLNRRGIDGYSPPRAPLRIGYVSFTKTRIPDLRSYLKEEMPTQNIETWVQELKGQLEDVHWHKTANSRYLHRWAYLHKLMNVLSKTSSGLSQPPQIITKKTWKIWMSKMGKGVRALEAKSVRNQVAKQRQRERPRPNESS
ncbi:hypothetical protein F5878DRAFT_617783 [Lentinula raphanica]|uniref:Uncharacterized protein n=1 Tax=Lentinula raphanica TaxID=153919 RepID=A0AA38PA99_9AGAR|nr:hypothetical protein F5878DRAFT_617783 [Lentinula raphanica]